MRCAHRQTLFQKAGASLVEEARIVVVIGMIHAGHCLMVLNQSLKLQNRYFQR